MNGADPNAGGAAPPAAPTSLLNAGAPPTDAGSAAGARDADNAGGAAAPPGGADPRDWLPEAYRANPAFKDIPTIEVLAKSYDNAARMVGLDKGKVLRLPADEAAPEWGDIYAQLGRPEKPDGYQFSGLPEGMLAGVEPAAREACHKLGLSAKQAAGVMELYGTQVTQAREQQDARAVEVAAAVARDLKAEWGDAYDDTLHAANRAVIEIGGRELAELLANTRMPDGSMMGAHPKLVKAFAEVGKRLAEPGDLRGGSGTGGTPGNRVLTPAEAQAEIQRLQGDAEFTKEFMNPRHPNRAKHMERWTQLHAWAHPNKAA